MGSPLSPVIADFFMDYFEEMDLTELPISPSAVFGSWTTLSSSGHKVQTSRGLT
jgi:hypothetical protein